MEAEAELGSGKLSEQIGFRRRSTSFSDDYSVQKTNDDATECKYAAAKLSYFSDPFIHRFIQPVEPMARRDPEILRGYWARVAVIKSIVDKFIETAGPNCQILNLGSGFDTLFWRLKGEKKCFGKFVDVDFSSVTAKKIRFIRKPGKPDLKSFFSEPIREAHHADLHCGDYHLVGADIRQSKELKEKLESTGLDFNFPTLVIAECVLVYMSTDKSSSLLRGLSEWFSSILFCNYEQVSIDDSFGKVMLSNLQQRGIFLPGLSACTNINAQRQRFVNAGYSHVIVWTMDDIYMKFLSKEEVSRIEKIEMLDELELLSQLLEHYCIVLALKDSSSALSYWHALCSASSTMAQAF